MKAHAHTLDGRPQAEWEELLPHLRLVARQALSFAGGLMPGRADLAALGEAAGLLHDAGKYDPEFQAYLAEAHACKEAGRDPPAPRVDHSTFGARAALERYGDGGLAWLLAYAVAGHHAGLPDGSGPGGAALQARLANAGRGEAARAGFTAEAAPLLPDLAPPPRLRCPFRLALFGRMLFSCLTDADALATEGVTAPGQAAARAAPRPGLAALEASLLAHLEAKSARLRDPGAPVNRLRAAVLGRCLEAAAGSPGIYSLAVPTGGGKTLSSLAFALRHARLHGLRRVVYVIPYLSIIEQTARVFREEAFAGIPDAVVEHHSAYAPPPGTAEEGIGPDRHKLAAENWDAPVVVTTAVQFFESLFAARPSACRKLHNLAGAVVVLDEAQMLPVPHLRPCLEALRALAEDYGATVLLCTATQPALGQGRPLDFGLPDIREIVPPAETAAALPPRVRAEAAGALSDADLAGWLAEAEAALCIVDRRGWAARLYRTLRDARLEGVHHLSATLCAAHRTRVLDAIRDDLDHRRPCRVVSTQLVEAGVDLDFPLVLRVMAGLDSLVQAAGRCNREGRPEPGRLIVFEPPADGPPRGDLPDLARRGEAARRLAGELGWERLFDPATTTRYFELLYGIEAAGRRSDGVDPLDQAAAWTRLAGVRRLGDIPYRSVAADFRLIPDGQATVIVPWGGDEREEADVRDLIAALDRAERPGAVARRLQRYTVAVPPFQAARWERLGLLRRAGALGQFLVADPGLYHPDLGLCSTDPAERGAEEMVW